MEASSICSSAGCKKLMVDENADAADDRISALPDMVLHHILSLILSLLPTTDAVRTCILSKRFDNAWKSLPNLYFKDRSDVNRDKFMNFVDRVLTHHDFSSLHRFTLDWRVHGDVMRISTWISAAIRRKVRVLRILLVAITAPLVLPFCLFNSNSLEELHLDMSDMTHVLRLPTLICFSSLKKLTLKHVIFTNDLQTQQLFSGCPVLEELDLDWCRWKNLKAVSISCPGLKRFSICDEEVGGKECQITILSTSLEFFHCQGELRNDYVLSSTSSLVHSCLLVSSDGEPEEVREVAYRLHKLLTASSNTTKLVLSSWAFDAYRFAKELFTLVPVFKSLTHLLFDGAVGLNLNILHKILQNSPHLESLYFIDGVRLEFRNSEKVEQIFSPVPSCFSSHLKSIRVDGFTGSMNEVAAVTILLAYAAVLTKMVIGFNLPIDMDSQQEVREVLLLLPKKGSTCSIIFICPPEDWESSESFSP